MPKMTGEKSKQFSMSTHYYCQTCHIRAVVVGSADTEHCAGKYPFHCCCVCAVVAGWKGWQVEQACGAASARVIACALV